MGPITFWRRHEGAVSCALLMVRWTSNAASIEPSRAKAPSLHRPNHMSQQRAVRGSMAHEDFCWLAPALVLLGLPHLHAEVAPVPLALAEKVRDNSPLPLPLFLRSFRFLLPIFEILWDLPSDLVPFWAMKKPVFSVPFSL